VLAKVGLRNWLSDVAGRVGEQEFDAGGNYWIAIFGLRFTSFARN